MLFKVYIDNFLKLCFNIKTTIFENNITTIFENNITTVFEFSQEFDTVSAVFCKVLNYSYYCMGVCMVGCLVGMVFVCVYNGSCILQDWDYIALGLCYYRW